MATSTLRGTSRTPDPEAIDEEIATAVAQSDDLELVDPAELADLFADRWTLTEGGEAC